MLARKYHPDGQNADASETLFRKISEAYSTLSSVERRERYNASLGIDPQGQTPEDHKRNRSYVFGSDVDEGAPEQAASEDDTEQKSGKASDRFSKRPDGKAAWGSEQQE